MHCRSWTNFERDGEEYFVMTRSASSVSILRVSNLRIDLWIRQTIPEHQATTFGQNRNMLIVVRIFCVALTEKPR
jgi:hypothetical protein